MKKIVLSIGSDKFVTYVQEEKEDLSILKVRHELSELIKECKERNLYLLLDSDKKSKCALIDPNKVIWFKITDANIIDKLKFKIENLF